MRTRTRLILLAAIGCGSAIFQLMVGAQTRPDELTLTRHQYDVAPLLAASRLSAEALKGRTLWVQRCAYCHDPVGQPSYKTVGPWLDAALVQAKGEVGIGGKSATDAE